MPFVTENIPQTRMFIPIPDNPLHLASSSKKPLFLLDCSPSPAPSPTPLPMLQRKSSLKEITSNSNITNHTVRWTSPISKSRIIPSRQPDTINSKDPPAPARITSTLWTISQSLTLNESSHCEITLFEVDPHFSHSFHRGKDPLLSFSRPTALVSQSEELQARMNLMHLHKVILPKILSLSISMYTPNRPSTSKHFSKAQTHHKPSRRRVPTVSQDVFRPAMSINIPRHARSNQSDSPLRLKRRSSAPDPSHRKRPRKAPRTDENTLATSFRESDAPATDVDGLPSLKSALNQAPADDPYASVQRNSSAEPPSSSDDSDDDEEALSDSESLFGDHEFMAPEVPVPDDVAASARTQRPQFENSVSQTQGSRRPLNSIKVVTWTNGLKRFDYLLQNNKMDWRCDDELYELLKAIDVEKDNVTIELLKKTHVGKMIRDLSKCDEVEERSRMFAKRIYKSWLKMCREVDQ